MSHVATVKHKFKDLDAVRAACKRLGLEFREGQKTFRWYGRWVNDYNAENAAYQNGIKPEDYGKCDHAIGIPGDKLAYEIGVIRQADGTYIMAWDFFFKGYGLMQHVSAASDENCEGIGKLIQAYVAEVAKKRAVREGFTVRETVGANGEIKLQVVR